MDFKIKIANGSLVGNLVVDDNGMVAMVGFDLYREYKDALDGIIDLYNSGNDLCRIIMGEAPERGLDKADVPKHQRFCSAVEAVKAKSREKDIPVALGYIDNETELATVWYITTEAGELTVLEYTPKGVDVFKKLGSSLNFQTNVIEVE